ncbi:MAG: cell envelope biogenesis protein OmpA [Flavobacteriaceae bacterium]|nr:cell envelope biogenesis protein OmpA [Flavobacteriaceae bacterium]
MIGSMWKFRLLIGIALVIAVNSSIAQPETNKWKFHFALGINSPFDSDSSDDFKFNSVNFPSINLGIQHMFNRQWGAKFDLGYNRAKNDDNSTEFKLNYTRINLQAVYDFKDVLAFMPLRTALVLHAGPGLSFSKPLSPFSDNNYTYLNALAGLEVHYGVAQTVSVYADLSYAFGFSGDDKYDPAVDGFSFNGDVLFLTVGVSVSLSGCYFCD